MSGNPDISALWGGPPQYVSSRVYITVEDNTTTATMNTHSQRLPNYFSTAGALLACVLWVYLYHLPASTFSLAGQDFDELAPASIRNTTSKPVAPQHPFDVEAFNSDCRVSVNQRTSDLVMQVLSGIANLGVQARNTPFDFSTTGAAASTSRQCPLPPSQFYKSIFQHPATAKLLPVRCHSEGVQPDVDTHRFGSTRRFGRRHFNGKAYEPLIVFTDDRCRFDFCIVRNCPVPSDADCADVLETQFAFDDFAAATVSGHVVAERVKAVGRLESRVTGVFASLASPVECLECFVERSQGILGRPAIQFGKPLVSFSLTGHPSCLFVVRPVNIRCFPAELFAAQRPIVKPPMRFEGSRQFSCLIGVGEQSEFEGLSHARHNITRVNKGGEDSS